ncbi:MAG: AAA family ATPase [Candidatus Heimdallarchaeota archaeon]|nr:AAA family ATPase [Candidatus Heimdallarchaeota archaeon]
MLNCPLLFEKLEQLIFGGGFHPEQSTTGELIHIFGKAGSGRTTLALQIACNISLLGQKVLYIDTEGKVSGKRIKELVGDKFKQVNDQLKLFYPKNFSEQHDFIQRIEFYLSNREIGLIVVDTITNLYRQGRMLGTIGKNNYEKLAFQVALLRQLAKKHSLKILLINQATISKKDDPGNLKREQVSPVAKAIMNYWADREIILVAYGWGDFEARIPGEFEGRVKFKIDASGVTPNE